MAWNGERIAREFVAPGAMERDHSHTFPTDIVKEMGENGLMGMFIPEEYGGAGLSVLDYVVALEEICYADAGVGVIMSVNNSLVCWPVWKFGNEEQKQKYLAPMASGEKLGCYALTEPDAGSDAAAQRTAFVKSGDDFVLKMAARCGSQMGLKRTFVSPTPISTLKPHKRRVHPQAMCQPSS